MNKGKKRQKAKPKAKAKPRQVKNSVNVHVNIKDILSSKFQGFPQNQKEFLSQALKPLLGSYSREGLPLSTVQYKQGQPIYPATNTLPSVNENILLTMLKNKDPDAVNKYNT